MDQDSFRLLLQGSGSGSTRNNAGAKSRGSLPSGASTKSKNVDVSQPAFKPRKVKKAAATESKYRDRAAERRGGGGNDYAHVEAVLEDFERRNVGSEDKKLVEEQRKYLGGDGEHSILVKGLDMALLEQNKARAALDATEDDDTLEQAYMEASSAPKKRTREDIINELKRKREGQASTEPDLEEKTKPQADEKPLEEARKQGKFKPIGFKPIGSSEDKEKKKKKKVKSGDAAKKEGGEERKKKKRKVEEANPQPDNQVESICTATKETPATAATTSTSKNIPESVPEPEALGDEFNIFGDVDDYEGIDLGPDDETGDEAEAKSPPPAHQSTPPKPAPAVRSGGWSVTEGSDDEQPSASSKPIDQPETRSPLPGQKPPNEVMEDGEKQEFDETEEEKPIRLQPLEGSSLPSIRDFLAMDEAAEAADKRRKRKEKKKARGGTGDGGSGKSMEEKVNRDFQRLQSYTSKKEASGTR